MANKPFDVEIINARERPLSSDVNLVTSYSQLMLRELLLNLYRTTVLTPQPPANGAAFIGSAFYPRPLGAPAMAVRLDTGIGLFNNNLQEASLFSIPGLNDESIMKPLVLSTAAPEWTTGITGIPNGDAANPRVDLIEVQLNRFQADSSSRDILNIITGQFSPGAVFKTLSYALDGTFTINGTGAINYKTGAPGVGNIYPTGAPGVDAGYVAIAYVNVPALATTITAGRIIDARRMLFPGGMFRCGARIDVTNAPATTMVHQSVPPGVALTAFNDQGGGSNPDCLLYLVAGNGALNSVSAVASVDLNIVVTAARFSTDFTFKNADATDVANCAAGSPALTIATGQPIWKAVLGLTSVSGALSAYTVRVGIDAQY